MSDDDASASFSVQLQQAIQQAVGHANEAGDIARQEKKEKRKKKRQRESDVADQAPLDPDRGGGGGGGDGDHERRKKKKKKKHHPRDVQEASPDATEAARPATPPPDVPEQDEPAPSTESAEVTTEGPLEPEKRKKKKKKKDKGKGKERAMEAEVEPSHSTTSTATPVVDDTSSAEFLSAVVAAASATSGAGPSQPGPSSEFPPIPHFQGHMPYPPEGFSFPPPPAPGAPFGQGPAVSVFPALADLSLAGLSSEELLRTIQDLDIANIASVLKTLGDAAAVNNVHLNIPPALIAAQAPAPPVRQRPVKSDAILGRPPKQSKGAAKRPPLPPSLSTTPPEPGDEGNPEHAHMLANVWMNAAKLSDMVKKHGLVYKKGKFSAIEEAQLSAAIENYRANREMTNAQLVDLIFSKDKGRESFWSEITAAVHLRPIIAVYHHVRRNYHPKKRQGKWMQSEDDALQLAVAEHGQQWAKIALLVGRTDSDCRDRYRNHILDRGKRVIGHWTKEEEEKLTNIVTEMTVQQGKDIDNDIFWGVVSEKMGGTRGRQQCRIKWTDSLSTQYKNQGDRPRWNQMDAYLLVHKVDSLNVRDDSEIDWKLLPDEHWNSWSAHSLQRRWLTMKRSIKGYEEMSHAEIMDILRTKKTQSQPPPPSRKRNKKPTSAESVHDSEDELEEEEEPPALEETQPTAGSSTGPGMAAGAPSDEDSD